MFFVAGAPSSATAAPVGVNNLIWADEFDGSELDGTKWSHRNPGARRHGWNDASAVAVADGSLRISTYTGDDGKHYTGMIGTQGKFETTYGYIEARIKFNTAPGMWSAFWLQSPTMGTPLGDPATAGTEIDILEHRASNSSGGDMRKVYSSAIHWDGYGAAHDSELKVHNPKPSVNNDIWHTYGLRWTEAGYDFFYDDTLIWTAPAFVPVSKRSEFLILSSEVENGGWAGVIPQSGFGSLATGSTDMVVDYVRVYHLPEPTSLGLGAATALLLLRRRQARL